MTTKYKMRGAVIDYVAGSNLLSGAVVVIGVKVGVLLADIASGATGSVQIAGVFELAKLSTDAPAQGALVYWDAGNSRLTTTVGSNVLAGHAHQAAVNPSSTMLVCLNSMPA